jgi:hypothetical protein
MVFLPYWYWARWFGMVLVSVFSFSDNIPAWMLSIQMLPDLMAQGLFYASPSLFPHSSLSEFSVGSIFYVSGARSER